MSSRFSALRLFWHSISLISYALNMIFMSFVFNFRILLTGISFFGSGSLSSNFGRFRSGGTGRTVLLTGLCFFGLFSFLFDFLGFFSEGKGLLIIRFGFLMTRFRTAA